MWALSFGKRWRACRSAEEFRMPGPPVLNQDPQEARHAEFFHTPARSAGLFMCVYGLAAQFHSPLTMVGGLPVAEGEAVAGSAYSALEGVRS